MAASPTRKTSDASYGYFKSGAVSCDSVIAAEAGKEILSRGGSAVDAAIATLLVNGMTNAHSMGLGGGFFMVYYDASSNTAYSVDSREVAPLSGEYKCPIAVPVELSGYREAHRRWGRLPWKDLFAPAIRCALEGYPVSSAFARAIRLIYRDLYDRRLHTLLQQLTNSETGNPYSEGEVIKWTLLAKSLETISKGEFDNFLSEVCADLKDVKCPIQRADFDAYKVRVATPLAFNLPSESTSSSDGSQSYTVIAHPPPSGGCIVSLILNLLAGAEAANSAKEPCDSAESTARFCHRYIECVKLAYPAYEFVGDAAFNPEVIDAVNNMVDPAVGQACGSLIADNNVLSSNFLKAFKFLADLIGGILPTDKNTPKLGLNVDYGGTAHLCVVAPNGDAVSVTSSINHYFGSRIMGSRTGVIWNNTIEDFAYPDRERFRLAVSSAPQLHFVGPGKRPVSAMSPIIVMSTPTGHQPENNENDIGLRFPSGSSVYMLCGGAGGSRIVGAVSYVLAQALLAPEPMLLSQAIATPRVRHWIHNSGSALVVLESGFCCELKRLLESRGHLIEEETERYLTVISGIQFVGNLSERTPLPWLACCDARKGGSPAGF